MVLYRDPTASCCALAVSRAFDLAVEARSLALERTLTIALFVSLSDSVASYDKGAQMPKTMEAATVRMSQVHLMAKNMSLSRKFFWSLSVRSGWLMGKQWNGLCFGGSLVWVKVVRLQMSFGYLSEVGHRNGVRAVLSPLFSLPCLEVARRSRSLRSWKPSEQPRDMFLEQM